MFSRIENWQPHKKWLASVGVFLSTALAPNDLGILALFVNVFPLGLYSAEMILDEDVQDLLTFFETENDTENILSLPGFLKTEMERKNEN